MANIQPFRGLRYDVSRAGDPADLLAPPYDVIDEDQRDELAERSEHNCVHVIVPEGEGDAKYARGAAEFRRLVREALVCDDKPSVYVYHQRFESEGETYTRKGFVSLVELTRFGEGPVLAHERTLAGPKADRLNLMRECAAHLELVFGMFSDPEHRWEQALDGKTSAPVLECDFDGVHHALYRVDDHDALVDLSQLLEAKKIYIADGHHRYETMCAFRSELERRGFGDDARWGMMYLSNLDDPGLVVLPTHRLVHGVPGFALSELLESVSSWFDVSTQPLPTDVGVLRTGLEQAGQQSAAFALAVPGESEMHVLTLKDGFDPAAAGLGEMAEALQRLDVALLHELVLERGLGITKEAQAAKTNLYYYKSSEAALKVARDNDDETQLVCFMNATSVHDVVAVCDSGEVMPQKSTFFYPKIPTGLVFNDLRPED